MPAQPAVEARTLIDALLEEQRDLSAAELFARWHDGAAFSTAPSHRQLLPLSKPSPGEQYAFEVDLDRCSGCKSCVTACHALNGLDDEETWRSTGVLHGHGRNSFQQTITTACHHCVEPGCLEGCPVLAYDKDPVSGIVRHLDDQCIGCQYCIFMCPYEVPKYSSSRGIVRKCDMCQQRLAHDEAPACVQACPNEAIRISLVQTEELRLEYRDDADRPHSRLEDRCSKFLPDSPDPAITLPTTRYVSAKRLPGPLMAGDSQNLPLQHAHLPLVLMLVFTQLGAGGFTFLPFTAVGARSPLALLAITATIIGVVTSIFHLGRPSQAWRAFLGLRKSWLSREIVVFGCFAGLGLGATLGLFTSNWASALVFPAALAGLSGVFCSAMTYHVTRRECWRGQLSFGRFFGTTVVLGLAGAWVASVLAGRTAPVFALALAISALVKLGFEQKQLRLCPDDAGLNEELPDSLPARSAYLMRFRLGALLRIRIASAWAGGIVLPLLSLLRDSPSLLPAITAMFLCLCGEFLERLLFFRAAAVRKMPGMPPS
ncbi:MAG TPA: DmsC/YnfH family molybdoenzyme membrane anchor subunit [Verrucomicrobiae bacterium]|nr:DmsC/YnfH family molybdoenzyme membrane anchor subunit [Verrucomicrobiae bacterium]